MTDERPNKSALEMMERCHVRLNERAAELVEAGVALAEQRDLEASAAVVQEVLAFLKRTGKRHIADEEQSIFPRLGEELAALCEQLSAEHREQEQLIRGIDKLTALWPARPPSAEEGTQVKELSAQLAAHYERHAGLEDEKLLPALKALSEEDTQAVEEEMQARRQRRGRGGNGRGRGDGGGRNRGQGRGGRGGGGGGGGRRGGGGGGGGGGIRSGGGDR